MATEIKAIPTLRGKEARAFMKRLEETERDFQGFDNIDEHPYCIMAREILKEAGMYNEI